jgi:hypothetical protein
MKTCNLIFSPCLLFIQTPNSPVSAESSAGRKSSKRIILVCQGATQNSSEVWIFLVYTNKIGRVLE